MRETYELYQDVVGIIESYTDWFVICNKVREGQVVIDEHFYVDVVLDG